MTSTITPLFAQREPEPARQTVLVIGGSGGIGPKTARPARAEAADLILTGRNPGQLKPSVTCRAWPKASADPYGRREYTVGGEARQAVASGADVIVAHCWEAGVLCEQFEQSIAGAIRSCRPRPLSPPAR